MSLPIPESDIVIFCTLLYPLTSRRLGDIVERVTDRGAMASSPNLIALLAVQQNVSDIQKQLNLYGNFDFVVDGRSPRCSLLVNLVIADCVVQKMRS